MAKRGQQRELPGVGLRDVVRAELRGQGVSELRFTVGDLVTDVYLEAGVPLVADVAPADEVRIALPAAGFRRGCRPAARDVRVGVGSGLVRGGGRGLSDPCGDRSSPSAELLFDAELSAADSSDESSPSKLRFPEPDLKFVTPSSPPAPRRGRSVDARRP
ncbi:hypothetical protein ACFQER_17880 [Halomicroarcula sp. GCM10025894]|uniref:hypothetical protein n=1 Tax=Halomicroarcula sp. GCM10025894 TaxID=3252673 RepID=UPI003611EB94